MAGETPLLGLPFEKYPVAMKKTAPPAKAPTSRKKSAAATPVVPSGGRVQMVDVARLAGVSAATVSRALSGHASIPEPTRLRIADMARDLGYKVNHSAANLRKGQTNAIGVVVTIGDEQPISDPFILSLIGHIADVLNAQGKNLLLTRVRSNHKAELESLVSSGQVSGLLVIGQTTHHATLNALEAAGVPMVVWGALLPDTKYSVVGGDNLGGGFLATRHLLEGGAKRILFLGDSKFPEGKLRYLGYTKALKQAGIKPDKTLHRYCPLSAKEIEIAINSALDEGVQFDAVFATSDVGAMSALATLASKNIRVPKQVRLVGYDNIPLSAYVHPTLTTIDQPNGLAALAMVDLLNEKIAGGASRSILLPATLIERKSSR